MLVFYKDPDWDDGESDITQLSDETPRATEHLGIEEEAVTNAEWLSMQENNDALHAAKYMCPEDCPDIEHPREQSIAQRQERCTQDDVVLVIGKAKNVT